MLVLKKVEVERYKAYSQTCTVEIRPLTILVGKNNSGKSALARVLPLIAGGFLAGRQNTGPLPLGSFGLVHGESSQDIVTDKTPHGQARFALTLADGDDEIAVDFTVQNVSKLAQRRQVVDRWVLEQPGGERLSLRRRDVDDPIYRVEFEGRTDEYELDWQGLVPYPPTACETFSHPWYKNTLAKLTDWAARLRYLQSPRKLIRSPFPVPAEPPVTLGADGSAAPLMLALRETIMELANKWFREAFNVKLALRYEVSQASLEIHSDSSAPSIDISQAGQGLSQVLPVVVQLLSAAEQNSSLDIIEHPEAEIHPQAHTAVADLIIESLGASPRPLIIETHSEELLLRVRREIAEGNLAPDKLAIYWIECEAGDGATARRIEITPDGAGENWPEGVFLESYEEVIAIRRAARNRKQR